MKVCVTEKPSVARDIAKILGANTPQSGYYEGNGYCVTWTYGHLCTLKEPADYTDFWKSWRLGALPMIPPRFGIKLIDQENVHRQFKVIESLIAHADEVINCGDAGQEGELIQRWVYQKAGCDKPVRRLWISSLTDESIREGFQHLEPQEKYHTLYIAGLCRAIGDWVLGINATRLYTLKYGLDRQILSIGRVQTPTLALIVNRQKEIEEFVPKDTWEIKTKYRDVVFTSTLKPFETEEKARERLETLVGKLLHINDVSKKKGNEAPPRLFDLTSLQVEANKKYGYSADLTLRTIQSLYEKKLTTYPRVDTTYLTLDVYKKCGQILNSMTPYQALLQPLRGEPLRKSTKVFDNSKVTDHHAIIPTGQRPGALTDEEQKVYDLVSRRFIAAFYPDFRFEQTNVLADVDGVRFKTTGRVVIDQGWKNVFRQEEQAETMEKEKPDEATLPVFAVGESGPQEPFLGKKTSQPPKYYTEGTLLKAMETAGSQVDDEELREALKANGIGRPSTRAAIIETLFKRGYIVRERKSLRATRAGIDVIGLIKEELLKSARLTGQWECKLRMIERGDYKPEDFIAEIKQLVTQITYAVLSDNSNRRIKAEVPKGDEKPEGKGKTTKTKAKSKPRTDKNSDKK